ncbi:hypothetical protein GYH30_016669 [Glycine max]|uniref:Uncharacterized protein n=2 Tax=Glycine subgen. Soja TaxID=1462606 RepID=A0A0R0JNE4_SOYBN|nr:hypothetical protein GYH30_016669 [Glycine max]
MKFHDTAIIISDQDNKESVPPTYNTNKVSILHMPTSFKNNKHNMQKPKRVPLADITNLFNNSVATTFTLAHHQQS